MSGVKGKQKSKVYRFRTGLKRYTFEILLALLIAGDQSQRLMPGISNGPYSRISASDLSRPVIFKNKY